MKGTGPFKLNSKCSVVIYCILVNILLGSSMLSPKKARSALQSPLWFYGEIQGLSINFTSALIKITVLCDKFWNFAGTYIHILGSLRPSFRFWHTKLWPPGAGAVGHFEDIVINKKTLDKSNINQHSLTIFGISMYFWVGNRSRILSAAISYI